MIPGISGRKADTMKKTVITVLGKDQVGIIAGVCNYLAENNVNVLDLAQTIIDGMFNMMMIVDISASDKPFPELSGGLTNSEKKNSAFRSRCSRKTF